MALSRYYKIYFIQQYIEKPSGFPPPFDTIKELGDGDEIRGLFIPDQSTEMMVASAPTIGTRGRFITDSDAPIDSKDTLREADTGFFLNLTGDPLTAPDFSPTQSKRYFAEIIERPLQFLQDGD